jgi:nucleotide-binding universal stress UspA family protein
MTRTTVGAEQAVSRGQVSGPPGIVVGVTGKGENSAALRWAAQESEARRVPVTLVHVVEPVLPPPVSSLLVTYPDLTEIGAVVAAGAAEEYGDLAGASDDEAPCRLLVKRGHIAAVLTELSERAELVVLAHRHLSGLNRIVTGSVTVPVAAHAHCPVVSVPLSWQPPPAAETQGRGWVTVGMHEAGTPAPVLQTSFDAAAAHGWGVRLVHAWRLDPEYDDVIFRRAGGEWERHVTEELRTAVRPLTEKHPEVPVELLVRHDWPADALVKATGSSQLLVLGRHGRRPMLPQRIGSLARTLLRTATCPLIVVPV